MSEKDESFPWLSPIKFEFYEGFLEPLNLSLSEQNQPVQANILESACIFE
jgi:hypothetical protein